MSEDKDRKLNMISLFGEEIELVRPKGRAGLLFLPKANRAFRKIIDAVDEHDKTIVDGGDGTSELQITGGALEMVGAYIDEEFIDDILPGLYMYSTDGLTLSQARRRIESAEISNETLASLLESFMMAMSFWGSSEDPEALSEAVKKSDGDSQVSEE